MFCEARGLIKSFLEIQWEMARSELKITDTSNFKTLTEIDDQSYMKKFQRPNKEEFLEKFYHYSTGTFLYNPNNTLVMYARICKCANEAIISNLYRIMKGYGNGPSNIMFISGGQDNVNEFKSKIKNTNDAQENFSKFHYKLNLTQSFVAHYPDFKIFTFIRDPLSHFQSGIYVI